MRLTEALKQKQLSQYKWKCTTCERINKGLKLLRENNPQLVIGRCNCGEKILKKTKDILT